MYNTGYSEKTQTNSNIAWHRPQSATCRIEDELMQKSAQALSNTTDPLEKLRLQCLARGAAGIMGLGRIFRRMAEEGGKQLNKDAFVTGVKETGLEISNADVESLFATLDTDHKGFINVDEFIRQIRPPMADGRRAIVEQAFRKLDKTGDGVIATEDIRGVYSCSSDSRIFRRMAEEGGKQLNKDAFVTGVKETGLEISNADVESLFATLDTDHKGFINVDEFIRQIRPPMADGRRAIVEQAFRKLDKTGDGVIATEDIRGVYSCSSDSRYKSGEETAELIINKFLSNFESEGTVDGKVTLEEFMNFYSGISVSIDNDCNFDLIMRQTYKL